MTIDPVAFAPTAALIAGGLFVYFQTARFASQYEPKVDKFALVLMGQMLEEVKLTETGDQIPSPSPYFPEAGIDEVVARKLVTSQRADDYRRSVSMVSKGNRLIRGLGLGIIALGIELFPFFLLLPDPTYLWIAVVIGVTLAFIIGWFARYHILVSRIDEMDTTAKLGTLEVPWRR